MFILGYRAVKINRQNYIIKHAAYNVLLLWGLSFKTIFSRIRTRINGLAHNKLEQKTENSSLFSIHSNNFHQFWTKNSFELKINFESGDCKDSHPYHRRGFMMLWRKVGSWELLALSSSLSLSYHHCQWKSIWHNSHLCSQTR